MAKRVSVDRLLFIVTLLLVFVGLVMVFSASAVMAKERYHSGYFFLLRQLGWAVAGFIAMLAGMKIDYKRLKHPAVVFSLLGITTLMLISVFFLDRAHNTHRWMHFGGFSFQPSELAKPVLILFLAFFLENRTRSMDDWRNTLLPAVLPTLVFIALIVFQPDLGTAIACAAITVCILFVAGLNPKYLVYGFVGSLLPLYFLIFHVAYRRDRILAFLDPYSDPQGRGFDRRFDWCWPNGGQGKTILSAGAAYRLHILGARRGTGPARLPGGCALVRNISVARCSNCAADRRHIRQISCRRNHQHGGGAGLHQHQRGARPDAHQGTSSAADLLGRVFFVHNAGLRGGPAEHHQTIGVNGCLS